MPTQVLRRGLPRVAGGEPWPPQASPPTTPERAETAVTSEPLVRRGLPRTAGGAPWPPTQSWPRPTPAAAPATALTASAPGLTAPVPGPSHVEPAAIAPVETNARAAFGETKIADTALPLPFRRSAFAGTHAFERATPAPAPRRIGPYTGRQWAALVNLGGAGALVAAAMAVLLVRWVLSLEPMQDFLRTYPGEYPLPVGAPVGFPAWVGWQHFLNAFLIVLIIRSGLSVRYDKRPSAYWTGRGKGISKIGLMLWFHQSLDILWLVNGVIFVVLLFATGQWMRVVPTSWEVFPNAVSAALQYVSLNWPTENGWVNYNSLQQLAYGTTVFVAAPLAAASGWRMSGLWPRSAARLSRAYPLVWARAIHFPVMLYFAAFIFVHVTLVFATGALRNLNHMYAMQGSEDGVAYADNWTGFWMFAASLLVIAAALAAARPSILAPIARVFGSVSAR
ncbi:cytochrome b/b6 domain-containing protein [Microbacterium pygmaeum]|uniref:Thiosulfate reductase cytochrome b subunit n=1 Tax=Microbacterium pygmaeum TaxID=370764 RepID=A0A1G7XKQ0_9MICO|nr:cytochrome b/b6 domain-containing protein [Microbacterium pygmaeum]SDG84646.1 Thiosulfate reductase cytochrome b subunit [Microbacterium pygmaeum]